MKALLLLLCVALLGRTVAEKSGNSAMDNGNEMALHLGPSTFSGSVCAQQDIAVSLSSDGRRLEVSLNNAFTVRGSAKLRHARIACSGITQMNAPQGYIVGVTSDQLLGFISIPENDDDSFAQVSHEYFFQSQRRSSEVQKRFKAPGASDSSVEDSRAMKTIWSSKCGVAARLRINITLVAHGQDVAIGLAPSHDKKAALRFSVEYKECEREDSSEALFQD